MNKYKIAAIALVAGLSIASSANAITVGVPGPDPGTGATFALD